MLFFFSLLHHENFGHCNEYNFIRRNFIQKFGWTIPKPSNKRYFYFQLNLSAMLKYVIKTVVKTRKTHISFLKIWCVILQKKMRDSYSLVRRCKHTRFKYSSAVSLCLVRDLLASIRANRSITRQKYSNNKKLV